MIHVKSSFINIMDFSSILITVALFVTSHVGGNVVRSGKCPHTFEQHGDRCYRIMTVPASWPEAKVYCQIIGGELAQITSPSVQDIIYGIIAKSKERVAHIQFWIDGSDMLQSRVWRWMGTKGNSIPFSYTNWIHGNPSDIVENCVELIFVGAKNWNDLNCAERRSFICQARTSNGEEMKFIEEMNR